MSEELGPVTALATSGDPQVLHADEDGSFTAFVEFSAQVVVRRRPSDAGAWTPEPDHDDVDVLQWSDGTWDWRLENHEGDDSIDLASVRAAIQRQL